MSDKVTREDAVVRVTRTTAALGEQVDEKHIDIRPFTSATATVSVQGGATVNLGNYESARISIMVSMPCYPEEVGEVYDWVKQYVDDKLSAEYRELREAAEASNNG